MMETSRPGRMQLPLWRNYQGFTLVELMIGIVVSAIVATGVISAYENYTRSAKLQRQLTTMMQNLRGSVFTIEREIRMAGYDPNETGDVVGIEDIKKYAIPDNFAPLIADANGSPVLSVAQDENMDGIVAASERKTFLLYDDGNDGMADLGVEETGSPATRQLVAENIEGIGFAYAYDADGDKQLELSPNGNIIWAVDRNQDNALDTQLDINDDGLIDENDETSAGILGVALAAPVPMENIRMARIWLLAQTGERATKCVAATAPSRYIVGDRIITDPQDCFRRRTLVQTVNFKNMAP